MIDTVVLCGDEQAEALTLILRKSAGVRAQAEFIYCGRDAVAGGTHGHGGSARMVVCEQIGNPTGTPGIAQARRVRFPRLRLNLLWPLSCANRYNKPDPPLFASGRFPYGDSFVLRCVERGISPKKILQLYHSPDVDESWPDLNKLFQRESVRLSALDSACDVRLGSFILKHFRTIKLFVTIHAPTNVLLGELAWRIADTVFGASTMQKREISEALGSFGARDFLGTLEVPIHPRVAQHFGLAWYDPHATYNYFDMRRLSHDEYINGMIAGARGALSLQVTA